MHLPNHYLDPTVCVATAAMAAGGLSWAATNLRRRGGPTTDLTAATAAAIFAAQMLNFPVATGTSGHLVGAALAAILLGPAAAILAMAVVLVVQCFLFGDGGAAALGANILNMGLIAPLVGWAVYQAVCGKQPTTVRRMLSAAAAAWLSVVAAAVACSFELAISGASGLGDTLAAMTSIHAQIGIGEAFITAGTIALVAQAGRLAPLAAFALVALAPLASALPDGLEAVGARLRFTPTHTALSISAPLADYITPGITWPALTTIVAGLLGIVTCAAAAWGIDRALMRPSYFRNIGSSASPRESK